VSWFSTAAFHFELPGDRWEEQTLHLFRPPADARSAFAISRNRVKGDSPSDIESALRALPTGRYDERSILRSERRQVGPLEAQDVSAFARSGSEGEYYRVVNVAYYELELSFQWAGPMETREEVDARVERTLESLKFRRR